MATVRVVRQRKASTPEQITEGIRLIENVGLSIRDACRQCGLSRSALARYLLQHRQREINAAGDLQFESSLRHSPAPKSWHCSTHGPITVWPCVACAAIEYRNNMRRANSAR